MTPEQAEMIIKQHGAKKLSKSGDGIRVLKKAGEKYKLDLLQPGQPGFKEHWGHRVIEQKLARERQESISRNMKGALQERKEWEAEKRSERGTDWKRKKL